MAATAAKAGAKVRYIGRRSRCFGRPLWEILLNLKDLGVGRLVIRSKYDRYPEPTYYKILSAEPHVFEYPNNMKGKVIAEPTFRGRQLAPLDLGIVGHFDDFRLLHKHEEEEWKNKGPAYEREHVLPRYGTLPPVWLEILEREKGRELTDEERRMKMVYNHLSISTTYRIAEEGEKPSFDIGPGIDSIEPGHMSLYKDVVWTRQPKDQEKEKGDS